MTNLNDFKITTSRMLLVPIGMEYKDVIFQEFTEEVARFLYPKPTGKIEDTENFINVSSRKNLAEEELQLVAIDKNSGEFLGCVGLHDVNTKSLEFGLWFKKSTWGLGYGKESMLAIKEWVDQNLDYDHIRYPVFKINMPSRKIAEFLGGKISREFIGKNMRGEETNEVEYLIRKKSF